MLNVPLVPRDGVGEMGQGFPPKAVLWSPKASSRYIFTSLVVRLLSFGAKHNLSTIITAEKGFYGGRPGVPL